MAGAGDLRGGGLLRLQALRLLGGLLAGLGGLGDALVCLLLLGDRDLLLALVVGLLRLELLLTFFLGLLVVGHFLGGVLLGLLDELLPVVQARLGHFQRVLSLDECGVGVDGSLALLLQVALEDLEGAGDALLLLLGSLESLGGLLGASLSKRDFLVVLGGLLLALSLQESVLGGAFLLGGADYLSIESILLGLLGGLLSLEGCLRGGGLSAGTGLLL